MSDNWLSIPQLAAKIGTSDNTVRRYIKRFPDFFFSKTIDGVKKYPKETIKLLLRITTLYQDGKGRTKIGEILQSEYPQTIDVTETDPANNMPIPSNQMPPEILPSIKSIIGETLGNTLQIMADQKTRIEQLEKDNRALHERLLVLENRPEPPEPIQPAPAENPPQKSAIPSNPNREEVMQLMKDLKAQGKSNREIAEHLQAEGIPTFSGRGKWHKGTVGNLVKKVK